METHSHTQCRLHGILLSNTQPNPNIELIYCLNGINAIINHALNLSNRQIFLQRSMLAMLAIIVFRFCAAFQFDQLFHYVRP